MLPVLLFAVVAYLALSLQSWLDVRLRRSDPWTPADHVPSGMGASRKGGTIASNRSARFTSAM